MRHYEFQINITVEGIARRAGEVLPESDIPAGCLENLVRMSLVREVQPVKPPEAPLPAAPVQIPQPIAPALPVESVPQPDPVIPAAKPSTGKRHKR